MAKLCGKKAAGRNKIKRWLKFVWPGGGAVSTEIAINGLGRKTLTARFTGRRKTATNLRMMHHLSPVRFLATLLFCVVADFPAFGKTPVERANPLVGTASLDDPKLLGNAPPPGEEEIGRA